jgi:hypothetical protein
MIYLIQFKGINSFLAFKNLKSLSYYGVNIKGRKATYTMLYNRMRKGYFENENIIITKIKLL